MSSNRSIPALALAGVLAASGCSTGYAALGAHTATVYINGAEIGERPPVRCDQSRWTWFIETLEKAPGFSAQIETGDEVVARGVQIDQLGGFTGSFWDGTVGKAQAEVTNGVFQVEGSAEGYYHQAPLEEATAEFVIRTNC